MYPIPHATPCNAPVGLRFGKRCICPAQCLPDPGRGIPQQASSAVLALYLGRYRISAIGRLG